MADPDRAPAPAGHFATSYQQRRAALVGLWLFLATEAMMFGGLFMGVIVIRTLHSDAVRQAAPHLDMVLGGANTAILLTSSMIIALAVVSARQGRRRATVRRLAMAAALGAAFLGIKALEYWKEYHEGLMPHIGPAFPIETEGAELFFNLYFVSTSLHALHLTIGVALVLTTATRVGKGLAPLPSRRITVEATGLYWHFVDIVWVFLYPVLYLVGR